MVTFVDETTSGGRRDVLGLPVTEERLTLAELIRRRIFEETPEGAQEAYERALADFGGTASWCSWGTVSSPASTSAWTSPPPPRSPSSGSSPWWVADGDAAGA
jgi:hypothetical protein